MQNYQSLDLTEEHLSNVHQNHLISSWFIQQHFNCPKVYRNLEEVWEKHKAGSLPCKRKVCGSLQSFKNFETYKQELIMGLTSGFSLNKTSLPNWTKLLNGQPITIKNNVVKITTTSLNFKNIENFVHSFLEMWDFGNTFLNAPASYKIDSGSVQLKDLQTLPSASNLYLLDDFEKQQPKFTITITFDVIIKLNAPIPPSKSLKKYEQSLKVTESENFLQIIRDVLEHPDEFIFSRNLDKISLKPKDIEEASEYFYKTYNKCKRLRFYDLFRITDQECASYLKPRTNTIKAQKSAKERFQESLLSVHLQGMVNENRFLEIFKNSKDILNIVCNIIEHSEKQNDYGPLKEIFEPLQSFTAKRILQVNPVILEPAFKNHFQKAKKWLFEIRDALNNINQRLKIENSTENIQSLATAYLRDKIMMDPTSYIEDEDELISNFAKNLLNGY